MFFVSVTSVASYCPILPQFTVLISTSDDKCGSYPNSCYYPCVFNVSSCIPVQLIINIYVSIVTFRCAVLISLSLRGDDRLPTDNAKNNPSDFKKPGRLHDLKKRYCCRPSGDTNDVL